jgi:esterase/lipase superfamily enzyme
MIIVSCRKDFASDYFFSDALVIRDYPNPANLAVFTEISEQDLQTRASGRHVVTLVHGYRNPLKNANTAYKELAKALVDAAQAPNNQYGLAVGFAWPGYRTRALGFIAARPSANRSGGYLRTLLHTLRGTARTVDLQTHSLGARVALQALSTDDTLWIDNLMMTAPAVDNESLEPNEEFFEALDSCGRVFVYHSKNDPVLKTYVVAALDRALGAKGPEHKNLILAQCPNVHVVDCQSQVKAHSDYRKKQKYIDHWAKVMSQAPLPRYDAI